MINAENSFYDKAFNANNRLVNLFKDGVKSINILNILNTLNTLICLTYRVSYCLYNRLNTADSTFVSIAF